jgi:putative spermidine/putrescine transport system substrate-binding protein
MSENNKSKWSRRQFIQASGAGIFTPFLAAPMVVTSRKANAAQNLVLVSWGGTYRTAIEDALTKPFEKETGVHVIIVDTPDMAKVKAQVSTRNVQWDVFDSVGQMAMTGSRNGYWESIEGLNFDRSNLLTPATKEAVPFYGFAGGVCWQSAKFPDSKHPSNFQEFFDFARFPGQRGLKNQATETLEVALLGDGVPANRIYPLDVDRAFRALEKLRPHVGKWIDQSPQTVSLVAAGQLDFSYTYSARARAAQESKQPIGFSFAQTLTGLEYLTVLKGAPNKENAFKFIEFSMRPDRQGALMNSLGYIPANLKATDLLSADTKKWLPDPKSPNNLIIDSSYWATHYDELTLRFKEWALS